MCGALGFVIDVRMGFGGVVSKVGGARSPVEAKLTLGFPTAEPPEAHVHGFHPFCDDSFVGNAQGCCVVGLNGQLWLRPTHFDKGVVERDHFFGTDIETCKFGFCRR